MKGQICDSSQPEQCVEQIVEESSQCDITVMHLSFIVIILGVTFPSVIRYVFLNFSPVMARVCLLNALSIFAIRQPDIVNKSWRI